MRRSNSHGLSIIEVLLATALAALLLSATAGGLMTIIGGVRANDSTIRARQAGTRTLEHILGKIRRAKELDLLSPTGKADEFAVLGTLDDASWDPALTPPGWSPTGSKYSFFMVADGILYTGPDENVANAAPLLRNVRSIVFRSTLTGTPAKHRDVTVEITLVAVDAGGKGTTSFSIAGDATARCEE